MIISNRNHLAGTVWTREIVKARMREAARCLVRMPALTDRDRPAGVRLASYERNYHRAFDDAFAAAVGEIASEGGQAAPAVRLGPPDPIAIDRMNEAIAWLIWLNTPQRRIVFAKAWGRGTANLPRKYRVDRRTVNRWHNHAIDRIVRRLNDDGVCVRLPEGETEPQNSAVSEKSEKKC